MFEIGRTQVAGAILAVALALPTAGFAEMAKPKAKVVSRPLNAGELYTIYSDKTWTWNTGGGRFMADGKRFVAWVDDKGTKSFAEGKWTVNDLGQMCMRATWTNSQGPALASTCFGHVKIGATIYQRRQPGGDWYVFKHARPRAGDEFNKLVKNDTVSSRMTEIRQSFMAKG